ncbi:hypothetical protein V2I01_16690 [Micromonospora sp. BRA006-A]|nr:hypothetical protein [Micromonospora sp. BRA006-A]
MGERLPGARARAPRTARRRRSAPLAQRRPPAPGAAARPDDRLRDLVRGLVAAFEPDPKLVGPLVRDYECVARAIADAMTSTEPPGAVADAR